MKLVTYGTPRNYLKYREGSGGTIEIYDIAVGTTRSRGKGERLFRKMLAELPGSVRFVYLFTRESNEGARKFYHRLGFYVVALIPGFYTNEPAVMFGLYL